MRDGDLIDALERESNPTGSNSDGGEGCIIIVVLFFAVLILIFGKDEFKTEKKIEPTVELITDGKTVDTVYIYRKNDK